MGKTRQLFKKIRNIKGLFHANMGTINGMDLKEAEDIKKRWQDMTQQSHCWAYTPRKPEWKETRVPQGSLQHCLQQPGHGSNLDVHRQMNGQERCGTYTQWNITQPLKRMHLNQF